MKVALYILLGAAGMYLLLKAFSKLPESTQSSAYIKEILLSQQFRNLARTNEFRELLKTPEVQSYLKTLALEQLKDFSKAII